MSLKGLWKRRVEQRIDAAFAAKHPMPDANGWYDDPFAKLDKLGMEIREGKTTAMTELLGKMYGKK